MESASKARAKAAGAKWAHPLPGEEIVITGLSGKFPDCDNVYEFTDNLFNKTDLISDDDRRWKLDHPEIPQRTGKIKNISKFDASFFGCHYKQAITMDPMCRLLLEKTYEAIVDAGINPSQLRGTRCGVFIGACFSETEKTWFFEKLNINGYGIMGCSRTMLANRISYWLGVQGPSYIIDSACSSSLYALEQAYHSLRDGHCDSAVVGSCNLCLHPYVSLQFYRLGVLSNDGACKSFDNSADGYCRSEAIPVVFLQKAKDAKRIYATVVHCKSNCDGYKEQGITYPSGQMQYELLKEFYEECDLDPATVDFIEAHGTGTKVGDPEECNSLDKVFCNGRKGPLLIGSIKSNIGHSEPASGLCSITKAIIAFESGFIPPNLHFKVPRDGIPAFIDGRLKVVTEKLPWGGGTIGINSFGFGGANCHILLRSHEKKKVNGGAPKDDLPRLVFASGRNIEAVKVLLDELESNPIDVEYIKLLHDIHSVNTVGHFCRGYIILTGSGKKIRDIKRYCGEKKELWLVFSGLGSQWPQMGKSLMRISAFASAIEKCHNVLSPLDINLKKTLTEDSNWTQNILHSTVAITAIQIGLVEVLDLLGLKPDRVAGHSFGNIACAYADGCLTAEQTILVAYFVGHAFAETELPRGAMVTVGMDHSNLKEILPEGIDIAYRDGPDFCTISGVADSVKKFCTQLNRGGIFLKDLPCFGIPLHSRHVAEVEKKILDRVKKIIQVPKPRSKKWIEPDSFKVDRDRTSKRLCSAEYIADKIINSANFADTCSLIPHNAVVLEVAPDPLLKLAFEKRNPKEKILSFSMMERGHPDNVEVLLDSIGKIYETGFNPQIVNLYPSVEYPVSKGTRMISPFIRWEHSHDWFITSYRLQEKIKTGERTVTVYTKDEDYEFMTGHVIDGRNLFPATGYLALVWETLGMMMGQLYTQLSIVFEDVRFHRATTLPKDGTVDFTIMFQKSSGKFEIIEGGAAIVSGKANVTENHEKEFLNLPDLEPAEGKDLIALNTRDIYKELRLRGYEYKGLFKGLIALDNLGRTGRVTWVNNYVSFMDNLLQTQILQEDTRCLYVPTTIKRLCINPLKHFELAQKCLSEDKTMKVSVYNNLKAIVSGGIEIIDLRATQIPRKKPLGEPVLERYLFKPYITHDADKGSSLLETIRLCFHVILENVSTNKVKVAEICDNGIENSVHGIVSSILGDLPLVQAEITVLGQNLSKTNTPTPGVIIEDRKITSEQNCLAVVATNLLNDSALLQQSLKALKKEGYLILRENPVKTLQLDAFNIIVDRIVDHERILLVQSKSAVVNVEEDKTEVVKISEKDEFRWIEPLKKHLANAAVKSIILVAEKEEKNGLIGLTNCLRREPGGEKIRCVFVFDKEAPEFDLKLPFFADQLKKQLAFNVYKNGEWGSYRHEALSSDLKVQASHIYFNCVTRGDLSSFKLFEGPLNVNKDNDEIIIYYASVNFRDVMLASAKLSIDAAAKGRINQELPIGLEFSGRLAKNGRRVMGLTHHGALASKVTVRESVIWEIPDEWTLEQAASIPVVYSTVYLSLVTRGRLKKGESILIHSGTGGVGLAALNLATVFECNIFTTVGTQVKRDYIRKLFPQIPESHIGNSRDTSFEEMVKRETNGRGVDLVLNSLAEEKLLASMRCLAVDGRFIEIGKYDLSNDSPIDMELFSGCKSFHAVHLDGIIADRNVEKREEVRQILQDAIALSAVKPLQTTVFDYTECEQAFRYLTTGKHIGKVLLKLRDEEPSKICMPTPRIYDCVPRLNCSQKKSYVILGGLGGFGLELADWLVMRGAKILVLNSRKGLKTGYQALRIRLWKTYGVEVLISTDDVTTEEGVTNLLKAAEKLGPVAAIFNLAVVLHDAIFENQTVDGFMTSFGPKAVATAHLDKVSRKLCSQLEHFVIFSSVSCGRGNAGQTNYGMANSVMERICEARVEEGYPGLAIQWGAIGEVGLVAEMQEEHQDLVIGGTLQQTISSCLNCLDVFLKQSHPIVASMVVAEKKAAVSGSGNIMDIVVNILGIQDLKTVSLHSPLAELGMDSMMAVEIKQTLERDFDIYLTAQDIRGLTFAKLKEIAAKVTEQNEEEKNEISVYEVPELKRIEDQKMFFNLLAEEENSKIPILDMECGEMDPAISSKLKGLYGKIPPVFFIPGLEGVVEIFKPAAKKINFPVVGLQYPYDDDANDSIQKIAQIMLHNLKPQSLCPLPFVIVGYSTGAFMAVEMAAFLEREFNRKGVLVLIDGSSDMLYTLVSTLFGKEIDASFDANFLHTIYNLFVPGVNLKIKEEIISHATWNEKVAFLESVMPERVLRDKDHQKRMVTDFRKRLMAIINYDSSGLNKLNSKIVLIKAKEPLLPTLPEDYNLSRYCVEPPEIHVVEGNHLTMIESPRIVEIINQTYLNIVSQALPNLMDEIEMFVGGQKALKTR